MYTRDNLIAAAFALPIVIGLIIGLYFLLRKRSLKMQLIPFMVIAGLLIVMEIAKQIISIVNGYNFFHIPLHICSVFLFSFALAVFLKQGSRASKMFWALSLIVGSLVVALMLIGPNIILSGSINTSSATSLFMSIHTIVYHYILIVFVVLAFMFGFHKKLSFLDLMLGIAAFAVFLIIAIIMSNVLDTNYSAFLRDFVFISMFDLPLWLYQMFGFLIYTAGAFIIAAIIFGVNRIKRKNRIDA